VPYIQHLRYRLHKDNPSCHIDYYCCINNFLQWSFEYSIPQTQKLPTESCPWSVK